MRLSYSWSWISSIDVGRLVCCLGLECTHSPQQVEYRPGVLYGCLRALQIAAGGNCIFSAATIRERERNRHESRQLPRRAIGSTLLLKSLEAEVATAELSESVIRSCDSFMGDTRAPEACPLHSKRPR